MVGGVPRVKVKMPALQRSRKHISRGGSRAPGGLSLFRQSWRPAGPPRAVLLNIHGLGDHSGLYPTLVDYCTTHGLVVHSHDVRGNGRSPGQRAYVERWEEYREDLRRLVATVRSEEGELPLFLVGNSLGGLIVLDYALHHPDGLRGVIAVSPPLGRLGVPAPLLALGRVLSRVWPRFSMRTGMDLSGLARDPVVVETCWPIRSSTGAAPHGSRPKWPRPSRGYRPRRRASLSPSSSSTAPPTGWCRPREVGLLARVGHPDHQLREYPGAYHVFFADLDRERVLADLERWIAARL